MAKLYLIPNLLTDGPWQNVIPQFNSEIINRLRFFIVEDVRNARRFIKKINKDIDIDLITFFELNKHTQQSLINSFLNPAEEGHDIGIVSEAGCPAIADPGNEIVRLAHQKNIEVVPLVGPSSILLALMASGLNGQNFAFNGYLPLKNPERRTKLKKLENLAVNQQQSQIFMETPYRNNQLMNEILSVCQPATNLCIATDITSENQMIKTQTMAQWGKNLPNLDKRPTIFILG